ncbi:MULTISPECIES: hypothetical protein [Hymenobacter]|nr:MULTISPECIES: hypothetical protein [unclassified Hymenobacter]
MTSVCCFTSALSPALLAPVSGLAAAWRATQPLGAAPQQHHHHL